VPAEAIVFFLNFDGDGRLDVVASNGNGSTRGSGLGEARARPVIRYAGRSCPDKIASTNACPE